MSRLLVVPVAGALLAPANVAAQYPIFDAGDRLFPSSGPTR